MGHELGHHIFDHHAIPVAALLSEGSGIRAEQAIQLFSWQRYAEISADRAGLACAGSMAATGRAFFKIASGLRGDRITFDIDAYLEQIGDIEAEAAQVQSAKDRARPDWFASHPFSPLRVRAAQLCAASALCAPDGMSAEDLEAEVAKLMGIMDPSYLHDKSDTGEAMRRLLFAGGVLVASASGEISDEEKAALERFLGEGTLPSELDPEALQRDLDRRIEFVQESVPTHKRAQVIRDICVIALADGHADRAELEVIREIAERVEVDPAMIDKTIRAATAGLD
jgi:tellurite resistance protein